LEFRLSEAPGLLGNARSGIEPRRRLYEMKPKVVSDFLDDLVPFKIVDPLGRNRLDAH
jgi:hypothetical protein